MVKCEIAFKTDAPAYLFAARTDMRLLCIGGSSGAMLEQKDRIDDDIEEYSDPEFREFLIESRDLVREIQYAFRIRGLFFSSNLLSEAADEIDNELKRIGHSQIGSRPDVN